MAVAASLLGSRNPDGGWGYAPGRHSRLEPTCWALLGLASAYRQPLDTGVLRSWPRENHWFVDVPRAPYNLAFNAIAALTLLADARRVVPASAVPDGIVSVRGMRSRQNASLRQDNSLQGWPWLDGTFSWVEPTAWCLLLLKKHASRFPEKEARERVKVGEAMLFDRVCDEGGWNYGNSNVLGQRLRPYVSTTALGLLALQDRRDHPVVRRSLRYLRESAAAERSSATMALASICLRVYGESTGTVDRSLEHLCADDGAHLVTSGNLVGLAMTLYVLALGDRAPEAFSL